MQSTVLSLNYVEIILEQAKFNMFLLFLCFHSFLILIFIRDL